MKFNHQDIVVYFSKVVATIINYIVFFIGLAIVIGIIYMFYSFMVDATKPTPLKKKTMAPAIIEQYDFSYQNSIV